MNLNSLNFFVSRKSRGHDNFPFWKVLKIKSFRNYVRKIIVGALIFEPCLREYNRVTNSKTALKDRNYRTLVETYLGISRKNYVFFFNLLPIAIEFGQIAPVQEILQLARLELREFVESFRNHTRLPAHDNSREFCKRRRKPKWNEYNCTLAVTEFRLNGLQDTHHGSFWQSETTVKIQVVEVIH